MDGSTSDLFLIPVMGAVILLAWLVVVFIADPEREVRRALAVGTIARLAKLEVMRLAQLETARLAQRPDAVLAAPAHRAVVTGAFGGHAAR